jgi:hypothetical protein
VSATFFSFHFFIHTAINIFPIITLLSNISHLVDTENHRPTSRFQLALILAIDLTLTLMDSRQQRLDTILKDFLVAKRTDASFTAIDTQ